MRFIPWRPIGVVCHDEQGHDREQERFCLCHECVCMFAVCWTLVRQRGRRKWKYGDYPYSTPKPVKEASENGIRLVCARFSSKEMTGREQRGGGGKRIISGGSKTVFGEGLYGMFSLPLSSPPPICFSLMFSAFVLQNTAFSGKSASLLGSQEAPHRLTNTGGGLLLNSLVSFRRPGIGKVPNKTKRDTSGRTSQSLESPRLKSPPASSGPWSSERAKVADRNYRYDFQIARKCRRKIPNLVVSNLVVCNFYAEALFCAVSANDCV